MTACKRFQDAMPDLASRAQADLPGWAADHVATCPACGRRLHAERLATALLHAAAPVVAPPADFAARVVARIRPVAEPREADLWRPAWKLMPAFGVLVVALFVLSQTMTAGEPMGFVPTDNLTAGESLALQSTPPQMDEVLSIILEGNSR